MGRFLLSFFMFACGFLYAQKIVWNEHKKLTWENFKAPRNYKPEIDSSAAYTFCGISYSVKKSSLPHGKATVEVRAVFYENKSWKKMDNPGDYLLKHEQLHFDIAELFARKIRKMVKEKIRKTADFDRWFKKEYDAIYKSYQTFQTAYDRDTKHSINTEKQEAYNRMVAQMLEDLSEYQLP